MREVISLQRTSFQQKSFFLQRKNCLCNLWTCIYIYKKIKLLFISLSPCLQHEVCMHEGQTKALNILEEILSEENGSQPPHNLKRGCNKLYGSNQQGLASPGPGKQEQTACWHLEQKWNLRGTLAARSPHGKQARAIRKAGLQCWPVKLGPCPAGLTIQAHMSPPLL